MKGGKYNKRFSTNKPSFSIPKKIDITIATNLMSNKNDIVKTTKQSKNLSYRNDTLQLDNNEFSLINMKYRQSTSVCPEEKCDDLRNNKFVIKLRFPPISTSKNIIKRISPLFKKTICSQNKLSKTLRGSIINAKDFKKDITSQIVCTNRKVHTLRNFKDNKELTNNKSNYKIGRASCRERVSSPV